MNGEKKLGWDDPISTDWQREWNQFFIEIFEIETFSFSRCTRPRCVTNEDLQLIIFCDNSELAFGCSAYIRWKLLDNTYTSNLLITIVKLELNSARLGSRLKCIIEVELRIKFSKVYFVIDSEISLHTVNVPVCDH